MELDRKLNISFRNDRSVEYVFSRRGKPLLSYVVEYPVRKVELLEADPGCELNQTPEGFLQLTWRLNLNVGWSIVRYRKLDKLSSIQLGSRDLLLYEEAITVKADPYFGMWLGSPGGVLSAVRKQSTALFTCDSGGVEQFTPRQLSEHVFRQSGTLKVRWVLEPLT